MVLSRLGIPPQGRQRRPAQIGLPAGSAPPHKRNVALAVGGVGAVGYAGHRAEASAPYDDRSRSRGERPGRRRNNPPRVASTSCPSARGPTTSTMPGTLTSGRHRACAGADRPSTAGIEATSKAHAIAVTIRQDTALHDNRAARRNSVAVDHSRPCIPCVARLGPEWSAGEAIRGASYAHFSCKTSKEWR